MAEIVLLISVIGVVGRARCGSIDLASGLQAGWIDPLHCEGLQWPGYFRVASALPLRRAPEAGPLP